MFSSKKTLYVALMAILAVQTSSTFAFKTSDAKDVGRWGVSIGGSASSNGDFAMAIGEDSKSVGSGSIAIGTDASVSDMSGTALGFKAISNGEFSMAVGTKTNVLNGSKLKADTAMAIGPMSEVKGGMFSMAMGPFSQVIDTGHATAIGVGTYIGALPEKPGEELVITDGAKGKKTIVKQADGSYTVTPTKDSKEELVKRNGEAYGATVLGHRSSAFNMGAFAGGMYSTAIGDQSVALGANSTTYADSATSIGGYSSAKKEESTALGFQSESEVSGSVAIGAHSVANRDKGEKGYVPGDVENVAPNSVGESAENKQVWQATSAAVSVGSEEKHITRQITNVAAGSQDADAVNVAQLKAVTRLVQNSSTELARTQNARMNVVENRVRDLEESTRQGFARQSALAGLIPPNADQRFNISGSFGGSGSKTAFALGLGYRPSTNLTFRMGVSANTSSGGTVDYNVAGSYGW